MDHKFEQNVLTLQPKSRLDSANVGEAEARIAELRAKFPTDNVVLDLGELNYISSAGLRLVLRLIKSTANFKVTNVNSDVYEIFDMTGFTEMTTIEKAFRKISVDGCEVIGKGANGKVYRLNEDTIVKVYLDPDSLDDIRRERDLAKKAFVLGIPTAISYDIARVGDGYGSVFELLNANSFAKILADEPERFDEIIDLYVDLLKKIHSTVVRSGDMPEIKSVANNWLKFDVAYLPDDAAEKLSALVRAIPYDDHMLHGDYHLKNVMMQGSEALLIDMDTLCVGDPVFEFAAMFNAYVGFHVFKPEGTEDFLGITHETALKVWRKTLEKYFGTTDSKTLEEIENKAAVIGYMRLMRRTIRREGVESERAEGYKKLLLEYLEKVESLSISR